MATPHVAGAAALYLSANPSATPADRAAALKDNATPSKVTNPGTGSPNQLLSTRRRHRLAASPTVCNAVTNGTDVAIPDLGDRDVADHHRGLLAQRLGDRFGHREHRAHVDR